MARRALGVAEEWDNLNNVPVPGYYNFRACLIPSSTRYEPSLVQVAHVCKALESLKSSTALSFISSLSQQQKLFLIALLLVIVAFARHDDSRKPNPVEESFLYLRTSSRGNRVA
jgi:hypothetical protein